MSRRIVETFGIVTGAVVAGVSFAIQEAAAERWIRIFPDDPYALFDADSIRRDANGMTRVVLTVGGPPFELVVNCRDRTSVMKADLDRGRPFERVNPDSVGGGIVARVCR